MTTMFKRVFVTSSLIAFAACGGGGGAPDDGGDDDVPVVDTTAPAIVSTSPADGEPGVAGDATLHVVFSEPMDQASVEAALSTSPFDPGEATLSWNPAGDTLTITPLQPLARGEGVGADPGVVQPIAHELKVGTGATDLAGNPLAGELVVAFTTEKLMTLTIAPDGAMTRVISSAGGIGNEGANLLLGDGANNLYTRAALTFDLAALPAELTGIEAATVGARQLSTVGTPYVDLGALAVDRVIFESMDASVFDSTALETMGSMSTDATLETKTADVTTAVQDDYANFVVRDGRSQFRLQFEETTDSKSDTDLTQLDYGTVGLVVVYTAE